MMRTSKSSKSAHRYSESQSFYQKLTAAAWGMVLWNPVPTEEIQSLHEKAVTNHEEAQQTSSAAQDAIQQSRRLLSSQG